jgi:xanthine dehydrogenase accessory factor
MSILTSQLLIEAMIGGASTLYRKCYLPTTRLVLAGRGPTVVSLAAIASQLEWDIVVCTPDGPTSAAVAPFAATVHHLASPDQFKISAIDAATAVVLLFHDHDWEPPILALCEKSPAFYVGALGSRRTHKHRKLILERGGTREAFIASIRSPVGLPIGGQSPPEIALSIAAEILSVSPTPAR